LLVASGGLTGGSLAFGLGLSFGPTLFFAAISAIGVLVTRSTFLWSTSLILGLALFFTGISTYGAFASVPTIQGDTLTLWFGLCVIGVAIVLRFAVKIRFSAAEALTTSSIALVGILLRSRFPGTNALAFQTLSTVGEDNAAWLQALADSSTKKNAVFGTASLFGGGTGTGASLATFRNLSARFASDFVPGLTSNAQILLRAEFLLALITAVAFASAATHLLSESPWHSRMAVGVSTGLTAYTLMIGMAAVGHYSAILATAILGTGVVVTLTIRHRGDVSPVIPLCVAVLSAIGSGLSWFPLMPLALLVTSCSVILLLTYFIRSRSTARGRMVAAVITTGVFLVGLLWIRRLFSTVLDNLSWDYFSFNMSLTGGVQSISGILALVGLVALVAISFSRFDALSSRPLARISGVLLPTLLLGYLLVIYLISFVTTPYSPRYGATKLLYVASCVAVPLTPIVVAFLLTRLKASKMAHLSIGPIALVALALIDPTRVFFAWPKSVALKAPWAGPIVNEMEQRPARRIVCLNTSADLGQDIWAYICSRMASGLQGVSTAGPDGQYDFPVWTAANIYSVPTEQAAEAWDDDFYRSLTILVFDPTRRDNGDPRQLAWLTDVDWTAVRVIGPDGKVIKRAGVPFTALGP
jgi:hypothetical protein